MTHQCDIHPFTVGWKIWPPWNETQKVSWQNSLCNIWFPQHRQHLECGVAKYRAGELLCFFLFQSFSHQQKKLQHILGLNRCVWFFLDPIPLTAWSLWVMTTHKIVQKPFRVPVNPVLLHLTCTVIYMASVLNCSLDKIMFLVSVIWGHAIIFKIFKRTVINGKTCNSELL